MNHTLSVVVRMYADATDLRLLITGCLTAESQRSLLPLIREVSTLDPDIRLIIDLTRSVHIETVGYDLLNRAVEHHRDGARAPAQFLLPDVIPTCPAERLLASRVVMA